MDAGYLRSVPPGLTGQVNGRSFWRLLFFRAKSTALRMEAELQRDGRAEGGGGGGGTAEEEGGSISKALL